MIGLKEWTSIITKKTRNDKNKIETDDESQKQNLLDGDYVEEEDKNLGSNKTASVLTSPSRKLFRTNESDFDAMTPASATVKAFSATTTNSP